MKDNEKKKYMAPQLTVVSFRSEVGYATSSIASMDVWNNEPEQVESYNQKDGWESGTAGFWG